MRPLTPLEFNAAPAGRLAFPANARIAIWGQSNAVGRADRTDISASPLSSDAGLATYDGGTFSRTYIWTGSSYDLLQPSVNNGAAAGQFGVEFGLAVRWERETASGNLYLEKWASSGLSITHGYFTPGVWPYTTAVSERGQADAWLVSHSITLAQESWIWIQGEADSAMSQGTYQGYLETLMAGRITDGFQTATDKSVLVQMAVGSASYGAGVAAAKSAIAAGDPTYVTALASDLYMKSDNLHYSGRGIVQVAYNCFETLYGAGHLSV